MAKIWPTPDPKKLAAIREWERPTDVTGVRSFVAYCNYYRKFVQNSAEVARPLYLLTSKGLKFTWTEEHDQAFQTLKKKWLEAPILAFPNFELPFIIDTDASETALGAVLSQKIDGTEYPIAFESRVLSKTEVNYTTTKRTRSTWSNPSGSMVPTVHIRIKMHYPNGPLKPAVVV